MIVKYVFLLGVLIVGPAAAAEGRAARLEGLKREFPACVVPLNENTDPQIAVFYRAWKERAEMVADDRIGEAVVSLRAEMQNQALALERSLRDPHNVLRSDTKAAIRKNLSWLRTRVSPWIDRLAQIQRGR